MSLDPDATRTAPPDITRTASEDSPTVSVQPPKDLSTVAPTAPPAAGPVDAPPGFVIEREIGVGGMGVVYLARQVGLNRLVALKLVKGGQAVDSRALIRFLAEAEAVAAVKHPHVVEVYQYGDHQGRPYLALEYCPGGDLTSWVSREATPSAPKDTAGFRKVAHLMAQVAEGVNAAHALGIVHRDLKPANVFLTADGTPKVADFGLAKRGVGSDLTNTQAVMGTPAYMAPEQAGGGTKFVGPEADVWALGVMLYELLCGQRPIDTSGPLMDALARVARGEVSPLRTKAPAVPPDLALIAHKCLSADPRDRYPTAGGLAADLRNWLAGKPISARRRWWVESATRWVQRNPAAAAAGTLGIAAAAFASVALLVAQSWGDAVAARNDAEGQRAQAEAARGQAELARDQLAAFQYGGVMRVAHREWRDGYPQASRRLLDETDPKLRHWEWRYLRRLTQAPSPHPEDVEVVTRQPHTKQPVVSVFFSPDGSRVLSTCQDGTIAVWDAGTGQPVLSLDKQDEVLGAAWSPDGTRVACGGSTNKERLADKGPFQVWRVDRWVKVWDAATGHLHLSVKPRGSAKAVSFSPDGTRLASTDDAHLEIWDAKSGAPLSVTDVGVKGEKQSLGPLVPPLAFSPDGTRIVCRGPNNEAKIWDAASGTEVGVLKGHTQVVSGAAFSPDGSRIVTASEDKTAKVWDAKTGAEVVTLRGDTASLTAVGWSPDGGRIVTASDGISDDMDGAVRVWDAKTGAEVLTLRPGERVSHLFAVAWSPDGTRIAVGDGKGRVHIWDSRPITEAAK